MPSYNDNALHLKLMKTISTMTFLNNLPLTLKGGTALLFGYSLDRMSTDLDFDANRDVNLESVIAKAFASYHSENRPVLIDLNLKKHTDTVKKYMVTYGECNTDKKENLKIEMSFRRGYQESETDVINNMRIYKLPVIFDFKKMAFQDRTVARDLHDIIFIGKNYINNLNAEQISFIKNIYKNVDAIFNRYFIAYKEDDMLKDRFLEDLSDLEKLVSKKLLKNNLENKLKNNNTLTH